MRYSYVVPKPRSSKRGLGRQYPIIYDPKKPEEVLRKPNDLPFLIVAAGMLAVISGVILLITEIK